MYQITGAQFHNAMVEAVSERGSDYTYDVPSNMDTSGLISCYYVHTDAEGNKTPGCLIGDALHRCGVPLSALEELEGAGAWSVLKEQTTVDAETRDAAEVAQDWQDNGGTWGEALVRAYGATDE